MNTPTIDRRAVALATLVCFALTLVFLYQEQWLSALMAGATSVGLPFAVYFTVRH